MQKDPIVKLMGSDFEGQYGRDFLAAIDKSLAVWPEDRFQDGLSFQKALLQTPDDAREDSQETNTPLEAETSSEQKPSDGAAPSPEKTDSLSEDGATPQAPVLESKKKLRKFLSILPFIIMCLVLSYKHYNTRAEQQLRNQIQNFVSSTAALRQDAAASAKSDMPPQAARPAAGREAPGTHRNSIGMEFVLIPAGSFMMGSEDGDADEKPTHRVNIGKPFYLGTYEVTQAQWTAVMGSNPSQFKGRTNPVEQVSWDDVQVFIKRLNQKEGHNRYRLPTEAEWEYAALAGTTGAYSFGDDEDSLGSYAWYGDNSGRKTHPVGQKRPNAWGLYDMYGNVYEWVQDWYGDRYYSNSPGTDPRGPASGSSRVHRGGCWYDSAGNFRSADRCDLTPGNRYDDLGFRLALSPE